MRPEIKNPYTISLPNNTDNPYLLKVLGEVFNEGADAMYSALVKYLNEPCTKHIGILGWKESHRYLCPECMAKLKES
jgi:hypothetical protein